MKYIRTAISEQETIINFLYDEQIIKIYSSRAEVIKLLTKALGEPSMKYKRSKSYWSGASWDVEFSNSKKIEKILVLKSFVDPNIEIKEKTRKKNSLDTKKESPKAKSTKTIKNKTTSKVKKEKTKQENIDKKEEKVNKKKNSIDTKKESPKAKSAKTIKSKTTSKVKKEKTKQENPDKKAKKISSNKIVVDKENKKHSIDNKSKRVERNTKNKKTKNKKIKSKESFVQISLI